MFYNIVYYRAFRCYGRPGVNGGRVRYFSPFGVLFFEQEGGGGRLRDPLLGPLLDMKNEPGGVGLQSFRTGFVCDCR